MRTITKLSLLGLMVALCSLSAVAAPNTEKSENEYTRSVNRPYEQVLGAVKQAAQAQGFRVSNVHDIAASLKKDGIERAPYATVEVCNSKIAAQVLQAEPLMGSVMPCRIAVFQKGNETVVSMIRPTWLMGMFPSHSDVAKAAEDVEHSMETIIDEATR
jgi:uncharacterized protein (DUF302 family)